MLTVVTGAAIDDAISRKAAATVNFILQKDHQRQYGEMEME